MCLKNGRMATIEECQELRRGWKIMRLAKSDDYPAYNGPCGFNGLPMYYAGTYYYAQTAIEYMADKPSYKYPTGFHICTDRESALKWAGLMVGQQDDKRPWVIVEVTYTGLMLVGKDAGDSNVHVASRITFDYNYELLTFDKSRRITN
jgi:hypothetical protein